MPNLELATQVGLVQYLLLSAVLFTVGMLTVLLRRNVIVMLMGIELMLNGVNLSFVAFSHFLGDINGQVMVFFVMTVAAAEAGVGLALAVAIFKQFKKIDIRDFEHLKG
ncbi:MAG: NADH-quinone oxidoreductase subunit NuoK [Pseudobdellovibrionaceae bacterium]|nr:NADH-quinone oxidoreductase subunit NuoK [Bdellovibrionales bacterium]USN46870.1 MAG: NADH-quinone oxidoreductase subunit NuoK [Pseudobdellovibrionaceae bacterium]